MSTPYLLAIDQGTTGSTALVLGTDGRVLARANREFPQHFPRPAWVEHEPDEIWASVQGAVRDALERARVEPRACLGIGITNQRETTLLWEKSKGEPLYRAIVWQDRRTSERCAALKREGAEQLVRERTGLVIDPYFSGTKLEWLLDNVEGARRRAEAGELAFGTVDSYLVYKLTGGAVHVTDVTNASRTLLFDIHKLAWDADLLRLLRVPAALLPEVRSSSEVYGHTRGFGPLPDGVPIAGIAGDQHAALFGQTCFQVGDGKCTYGTGAFLLVNTGTTPVASRHGLLTTPAWQIGGITEYALEGSAFIAGAAVQWLRDGLGLIRKAEEIEDLARQVDSAGDVVFVPALAGLGAPYWDPDARGIISGITRDTRVPHLARATLEGIAFQVADLARAMEADMGRSIGRLRVDGGASKNRLLMEFQGDLLGAIVERPTTIESTALGAAYLAGLAVGVFADRGAIASAHHIDWSYKPTMSLDERSAHLDRWGRAVARARSELSR
ncbi:MAG: Glycerol kinase [Myxococcaceae bacterium]|nr:Glycerol kinase [Myxococcaceae bacterium]